MPTFQGSPCGIKRLDLLYSILKGLEKHYTDYHNKPSEGLEPKMIEEITGKIYDVCQERIELKRWLEKEAQARKEEEYLLAIEI